MTGVLYVPLRYHGVERIPNKSQHTNLTLEKKSLPPFLTGFELATFRPRVPRSTSKYTGFREDYHLVSVVSPLLPLKDFFFPPALNAYSGHQLARTNSTL